MPGRSQTKTRTPTAEPRKSTRAKAREGKKAVVGYFSPELSDRLHDIAVAEQRTMQSLLGEAIDLLVQNRGGSPLGER